MSNKLFVGGLSWDTNGAGLRDAFMAFGEVVEAKVITDRETGRSRGFGFVTFSDGETAKTAMQGMDGQKLDGRAIRVNIAEERRPPRGGGGGGGGGGRPSGGGGGGFRGAGGAGGAGGAERGGFTNDRDDFDRDRNRDRDRGHRRGRRGRGRDSGGGGGGGDYNW